jgi:hypothetical protein
VHSKITDKIRDFFTDGSGMDYVGLARRCGFIGEGGETGAECKARRTREEKQEKESE